VLARNSHGFVALRYALMRLGAVMVPINFMLQPDDVAFILNHSDARMLACDSGMAEVARKGAELAPHVSRPRRKVRPSRA
jgi:fatty-acyl-CoA synthase